jgi:hypothetical protein
VESQGAGRIDDANELEIKAEDVRVVRIDGSADIGVGDGINRLPSAEADLNKVGEDPVWIEGALVAGIGSPWGGVAGRIVEDVDELGAGRRAAEGDQHRA